MSSNLKEIPTEKKGKKVDPFLVHVWESGCHMTLALLLRKDDPYEAKTHLKKAKEIAKKFAGNMTKAVMEIEKLQRGLSKNSAVASALKSMNEKIKPFMISYNKNGKHAGFEEIGRAHV